MDYAKEALKLHYERKGKIEICSRVRAGRRQALCLAYPPGVAQPCLEIQKGPDKSCGLTRRWNIVSVTRWPGRYIKPLLKPAFPGFKRKDKRERLQTPFPFYALCFPGLTLWFKNKALTQK